MVCDPCYSISIGTDMIFGKHIPGDLGNLPVLIRVTANGGSVFGTIQHFDQFGFGINITSADNNNGLTWRFFQQLRHRWGNLIISMRDPDKPFLPHCRYGGGAIIKKRRIRRDMITCDICHGKRIIQIRNKNSAKRLGPFANKSDILTIKKRYQQIRRR